MILAVADMTIVEVLVDVAVFVIVFVTVFVTIFVERFGIKPVKRDSTVVIIFCVVTEPTVEMIVAVRVFVLVTAVWNVVIELIAAHM